MAVHSIASSGLQVGLLPRLSKNLSRSCEKEGLSAPGVGFLNFETNYPFSAAPTRPSAWVGEIFGTIKDSVSLRQDPLQAILVIFGKKKESN